MMPYYVHDEYEQMYTLVHGEAIPIVTWVGPFDSAPEAADWVSKHYSADGIKFRKPRITHIMKGD